MKRPQFTTGEIYHVYNRGVEKRDVVRNDKDRVRFVHDLFEFNDTLPTLNAGYRYTQKSAPRRPRNVLVDILCFCVMQNHYHLLLRQVKENGVTLFMRKFGTGYTNFFNTKYKRVGPLFQGTFKAVHITEEAHLLYLPHYIHLNPLDMYMPQWRLGKISNTAKALEFLNSYRWSSYLDYIGKKNFPSLTQRGFLLDFYKSRPDEEISYYNELTEWLSGSKLDTLQDVALESMEVELP